MRNANILAAGAAALLLGACDVLTPTDCDTGIAFGVTVEVLDSATGRAAAHGAAGWVRDGVYIDSLRILGFAGPDSTTASLMGAAEERPGTYEVFIRKSGYLDWRRAGVFARGGECGVSTARTTARLIADTARTGTSP